MSSPKQNKTGLGLGNLLTAGMGGGNNSPRFVPPMLREVGKLAAGVASVSTAGSATGNPRNKCNLKPGHSHMDWVRLANSKDLSGLGPRAGTLEVTFEELAKHNKMSDGWLAINGMVYNVTAYFPFHPGGVEELMTGVGKDATKLFFEVHNWVNWHTLLKKCHVGRLIPNQLPEPLVSPSKPSENETQQQNEDQPKPMDQEDNPDAPQDHLSPSRVRHIDIQRKEVDITKELLQESVPVHSFRSLHEDQELCLSTTQNLQNLSNESTPNHKSIPHFDWMQKTSNICISFKSKPFSNPMVEAWKTGKKVTVLIRFDAEDRTVLNEVLFEEDVQWPGALRVIEEVGKVELSLVKVVPNLWNNYGVLKQTCKSGGLLDQKKTAYVVKTKEKVAENVFLLRLDREDGANVYAPIGSHFRVFTSPDDDAISRSYTPVENPWKRIFPKPANVMNGGDHVHLVVKRYDEGNVSKYICDKEVGEVIHMSRPLPGGLSLVKLHDKCRYLMIAAGTGITPMLSLLVFLMHRRSRKSQRVGLLFCNKNLESVPFWNNFEEMVNFYKKTNPEEETEDRIYVKHLLSDPGVTELDENLFIRGRITEEIVAEALKEVCRVKGAREDDFFVFVCGPPPFNKLCRSLLNHQSVTDDQIHVFEG